MAVVTIAILGGTAQRNGPAAPQRPPQLASLTPNEGDHVIPQNMVGVQIDTQYSVELTVDHHIIPDDQITGDPNLGEHYFEPGANKELSELPKGANSASVVWWPRSIPSIEQARAQKRIASYSWTFNVG